MSELKPGTYTISSALFGNPIGRDSREDRSLGPKGVFHLTPNSAASYWQVKRDGRGGYLLFNSSSPDGGAPVTILDERIFAILQPFPPPQSWRIEPAVLSGRNHYVISEFDGPLGWAVDAESEDDQTQIIARPLIVQPSLPPRYPPFEVFKFTAVDSED